MARNRWTHAQKLSIFSELDLLYNEGGGLKAVTRRHTLTPLPLHQWKANRDNMQRQKCSKKSLATGPTLSIKHLEEPLLAQAMVQWAANIPLTYCYF